MNTDSNLGTGALNLTAARWKRFGGRRAYVEQSGQFLPWAGDFFGGRRHRFDAERGDHGRRRMDQDRTGHLA